MISRKLNTQQREPQCANWNVHANLSAICPAQRSFTLCLWHELYIIIIILLCLYECVHYVIQAAVLHDTVEDTDTTFEELEAKFGAEVCQIVRDVSDDKSLPKMERKRLQVCLCELLRKNFIVWKKYILHWRI